MSQITDAIVSTAASWAANYGAMRAQEIIYQARKAPNKMGTHKNPSSSSAIRHKALKQLMNTTTKNYSRYGKHVDFSYWYSKTE